jgi:hypothetical protein
VETVSQQTPGVIAVKPEPTVPGVLRALADRLDRRTCARISPPDLYGALNILTLTSNGFVLRTAALDALAEHLRATGDDRWLGGWTGPRRRVDIVANIRSAAQRVEARLAAEYGETPAAVAR